MSTRPPGCPVSWEHPLPCNSIAAPGRFGKTLNLLTLRTFVERTDEDRSALFEGLSVWSDKRARREFQRHPVIWLSFKDVKGKTWELAWEQLRRLFRVEAERLRPVVEPVGSVADRRDLECWCAGEGKASDYGSFLSTLSALLHRATGELVTILHR